MQQPIYRSPRNTPKRNSSSIIRVIVIWMLVILVWVRSIFFNDKWDRGDDTDSLSGSILSGDSTYYVGEKILTSGVMTPVSSFTTYTHEFITVRGEKFWLKSKDIDLYQYSGSIDLKGEITDFKQDLPIITVTEIVGTKQGTGLALWLIDSNPDYYFFKDVGLGFDLSISQWYTVEQQADEILLIDEEGSAQPETVLTISPFVCKQGDNLKDCQALQQTFIANGNETYISAQDITFYNLTETKTWVTFNKGYGYYITPAEENGFSSFIDFMSYMSQERIQEAATKDISSTCRDINQAMNQVTSTEFDYQADGIVVVTMRGLDLAGNAVGCAVAVRLGNSLKVVPISFTPTEGLVVENDDTTPPTSTGTTILTPPTPPTSTGTVPSDSEDDDTVDDMIDAPGVTPPAQQTPPASYEGRLMHPSVRGYTMYFSIQGISFAGKMIDETDLGIDGLSCVYQLNIIQWARADQVDLAPDMLVYECEGSPSASALASKNLQQVGSAWDLIFLTKHLTSNLISMQIWIEEPTEEASE